MSNATDPAYYYLMSSLYAGEGAVIGIINLIVGLCIVKHEALRDQNHYLFVAGQCVADFLGMMAYMCAGIDWLILLQQNRFFGNTRSVWYCYFTPHRLLWQYFGDKLVALIQLLFAVDRLISITYPLQHMSWGRRYPVAMVSAAYGYSIGFGLVSLPFIYQHKDKLVNALCTTEVPRLVGEAYGWLYQTQSQIFSVLSLLVFGIIAVRMRAAAVTVEEGNAMADKEKERKLAAQRRFTKSLLINAGINIFFYVIPHTIGMMCDRFGCTRTARLGYAAANVYYLVDVTIYSKRHKEVRQGLKNMCKQMPANLELWNVSKPKPQQKNQGSRVTNK